MNQQVVWKKCKHLTYVDEAAQDELVNFGCLMIGRNNSECFNSICRGHTYMMNCFWIYPVRERCGSQISHMIFMLLHMFHRCFMLTVIRKNGMISIIFLCTWNAENFLSFPSLSGSPTFSLSPYVHARGYEYFRSASDSDKRENFCVAEMTERRTTFFHVGKERSRAASKYWGTWPRNEEKGWSENGQKMKEKGETELRIGRAAQTAEQLSSLYLSHRWVSALSS